MEDRRKARSLLMHMPNEGLIGSDCTTYPEEGASEHWA